MLSALPGRRGLGWGDGVDDSGREVGDQSGHSFSPREELEERTAARHGRAGPVRRGEGDAALHQTLERRRSFGREPADEAELKAEAGDVPPLLSCCAMACRHRWSIAACTALVRTGVFPG